MKNKLYIKSSFLLILVQAPIACTPLIKMDILDNVNKNIFSKQLNKIDVKIISNSELLINFETYIAPSMLGGYNMQDFYYGNLNSSNPSFLLHIQSKTYLEFLQECAWKILGDIKNSENIQNITSITINDTNYNLEENNDFKNLRDLLSFKRVSAILNPLEITLNNATVEFGSNIHNIESVNDRILFLEMIHFANMKNYLKANDAEWYLNGESESNLKNEINTVSFSTPSTISKDVTVVEYFHENEKIYSELFTKNNQQENEEILRTYDNLASEWTPIKENGDHFISSDYMNINTDDFVDYNFFNILGQPVLNWEQLNKLHSSPSWNNWPTSIFYRRFYMFHGITADIVNKYISDLQKQIDYNYNVNGIASKAKKFIIDGLEITMRYFTHYWDGTNYKELSAPTWLKEMPLSDDNIYFMPSVITLDDNSNFPIFKNDTWYESWVNENIDDIKIHLFDSTQDLEQVYLKGDYFNYKLHGTGSLNVVLGKNDGIYPYPLYINKEDNIKISKIKEYQSNFKNVFNVSIDRKIWSRGNEWQ